MIERIRGNRVFVFPLIAGMASALVLLTHTSACTPQQRADVARVIDIGKAACIIAHQMLPDSKVAEVCGIAEPYLNPMRDLLTSARTQTSQAVSAARTGNCPTFGQQSGMTTPEIK